MKKTNSHTLILLTLAYTMLLSCTQNKTAYIENATVYEKFKATIDLQTENVKKLTTQKNRINTLEQKLLKMQTTMESKDGKTKNPGKLLPIYIADRKLHDSLLTAFKYLEEEQEFTIRQKSWAQINTYIKDYGKENKYDMIHGASGEGNLMYAKAEMNITTQIIEYINKRYEGE